MRTLLVTGTATPLKKGVYYNVFLHGQTEEHAVCTYLYNLKIKCSGHTELIDICKKKYVAYFKTNEYNIITIDNLIMLPPQREQKSTPGTVRKVRKALMDLSPEARTCIYHKYLKENGWPKNDLAQKTEALHHHLQHYKGDESQLFFLLWYQTLFMHTKFPKDFVSWRGTFYHLCVRAAEKSWDKNSMVCKIEENDDRFAVADLVYRWTNTFERKYRHAQLGISEEYFKALDAFLEKEEERFANKEERA